MEDQLLTDIPAEQGRANGRAREHAAWLALWCRHTPAVLVEALVDDVTE